MESSSCLRGGWTSSRHLRFDLINPMMEQHCHAPRPMVLACLGPAVSWPIVHDSDRDDFIRDIGSGNSSVARLMRDRVTRELVAVKYIEQGEKSSVLHSQPKSTVGTPAYIAPEAYDGEIADVWSCGVTLYVMLVGTYPFEDPQQPKDFRKTIQRNVNVPYSIPDGFPISPECRHLMSRIFVGNPVAVRLTIASCFFNCIHERAPG